MLKRYLSEVTATHLKFEHPHGSHDDVIKWKHLPSYWPFLRRIPRSPVNTPHKGQWRGDLMVSLLCVWINGWVNNHEPGDLRRYRARYDVTVMIYGCPISEWVAEPKLHDRVPGEYTQQWPYWPWWRHDMETLSSLRTLLWGETLVADGFPYQKTSYAELRCFLWCQTAPFVKQTVEWLVSWDVLTLMWHHYNDVIMSAMASQITSLTIVYSSVYSGADQRKHQSSASLAFVRGIHRWPVNSPHKWPVTRKMWWRHHDNAHVTRHGTTSQIGSKVYFEQFYTTNHTMTPSFHKLQQHVSDPWYLSD